MHYQTWGYILGRNPDKSFQSFLLVIDSHIYNFALWFLFLKLTQPLTVSVKEERKPDRKPYPLPHGYEIHTETSSLKTLQIMPRNLNEIVRTWIRLHVGYTVSNSSNALTVQHHEPSGNETSLLSRASDGFTEQHKYLVKSTITVTIHLCRKANFILFHSPLELQTILQVRTACMW
jgi:hypothetical protein